MHHPRAVVKKIFKSLKLTQNYMLAGKACCRYTADRYDIVILNEIDTVIIPRAQPKQKPSLALFAIARS